MCPFLNRGEKQSFEETAKAFGNPKTGVPRSKSIKITKIHNKKQLEN